jgi:uncharacterized protein (UPF0179 family)
MRLVALVKPAQGTAGMMWVHATGNQACMGERMWAACVNLGFSKVYVPGKAKKKKKKIA